MAGPRKPDDVEPGISQRVVEAVKYIVANVKPDAWFGPGQPITPVAPEEGVKGRQFDYPSGINYRIAPRSEGGISFSQLRALADAHDITRLCIETRKDQVAATDWEVRMKDKDANPNQVSIDAAKKVLSFPDGLRSFQVWMRMLIEDMLVTDAACLEPRRNREGNLARLDIIDGTTIKPVLDVYGRTPEPPSVAYQQILKGIPAADFSTDELIYYPRNPRSWKMYGMGPVEQIIVTVNLALRRQTSTLQYYTEGTTPEGLYEMPSSWNAEKIKQFQMSFDGLMSGNTGQRRRIKFLPGGDGAKYTATKPVDLKDGFDEWLARIVCFCFSIPPTPFVQQTNRATAETAQNVAQEEGLIPILGWSEDIINLILFKHMGLDDVEFSWKRANVKDPLKSAQVDDIRVRNGSLSIDEVRKKNGEDPIGIGHGLITAMGWVPLPTDENKKRGHEAPAPVAAIPPGKPAGPPQPDKDGPPPTPTQPDATEKVDGKKKVLTIKTAPDQVPADILARLSNIYANFFQAQGRKAGKAISRAYARTEKAAKQTVDAILADLDLDGWSFLIAPTKKALAEVASRSASEQALLLRLDSDALEQANQASVDYADERSAELVGKKLVDGELVDNPRSEWAITDSTREMLRSKVTTAVEEGQSSTDLANAIENDHAFSQERAQMIARTELAFAHVEGNMAAWEASGQVGRKMSLLGSEHGKPDECDENAAEGWIGLRDEFKSGHQGPPYHPNCVCDLAIEVDAATEGLPLDIVPEET